MKSSAAFLLLVLTLTLITADAFAKGRRGSHRVGGTNSHGKHSHYIGGH